MTALPRQYLVVSDFHLTSGKDASTGRWSATEDFFFDHVFADFLAYYQETGNCDLIFNGDLCDFLQVLIVPNAEDMERYGIQPNELNSKYGLPSTEASNAFQMDCIMRGHPEFFRALGRFLAKGNRVVILKGNHDIQLYWPAVQNRIWDVLTEYALESGHTLRDDQIEFPQWFYLVPDMLYVEHGNQFENTTAFRNFLFPMIPGQSTAKPHLELDLSSFLVRYLTNKFEPINPLADNIRPLSKYYETIWKQYPWFAIDTIGTALKYVLKAFGKARQFARAKGKLKEEYTNIRKENRRRIEAEAARYCGIGRQHDVADALFVMDACWQDEPDARGRPTPTLERGAWAFAASIAWSVLKKLVWVLPIYLITMLPELGTWIRDAVRDADVAWLIPVVEFLHRFNLIHWIILLITVAVIFFIRKLWLKGQTAERRKRALYADPVMPDVSLYMRDKAENISEMLEVKYVTFGHTHYPDIAPLKSGGTYFNSGTWMGIFQPEENLYRDVRQYTFLCVDADGAELLHWNRDAAKPEPVVVIDTRTPLTDAEDSIVTIIKDKM